MKISILVLFMMTMTKYADTQIFATEFINNNVTLTVKSPYIIEGLESQVDIVCTFKKQNVPSMASILSMILGHSNKTDQSVFNYLVSVNEYEGHAHNFSHDVEVISGSIDNNGESKLHMRFMYPKTHLIGLYVCEVTGFDQIGKSVSIYSTVNVVTSNITELFDELRTAQSNIYELVYALHNSQANLSACGTISTNYYPPFTYNGHVYYLSHILNYFNRTEMQSKCEVLGGYLIELDSHDEFTFIRDHLMKLFDVGTVWGGATDEGNEGVWINKHNLTSSSSFDWGSGMPFRSSNLNCQCFYDKVHWFLADCVCYYNGFNNFYICEIPQTKCSTC